MITQDTYIQVHQGGRARRAIKFNIGDQVYDGFAGRYSQITDIVVKIIDLAVQPELRPIMISRDLFRPDRPSRDVWVSPHQTILQVQRHAWQPNVPVLERVSAHQFELPDAAKPEDAPDTVTYVALIFESATHLSCSGILIRGYQQDCPSNLETMAGI